MLKSCTYCGRMHPIGYVCEKKPKRKWTNRYGDRKERQFRGTELWKKKSTQIKKRDNYMCVLCLRENIINYVGVEVHHITPIAEDYEKRLDADNLITVCRKHHERCEDGTISRREQYQAIGVAVSETPGEEISPLG